MDEVMREIQSELKKNDGEKFDPVKYFFKAEEKRMHDLFRDELQQQIPNKLWETLGLYINGFVNLHTINVLVCVVYG